MQKQLLNILQAEIDPAFAKRARYILHEVEKQKPKKILDIGCGRGFYIKSLSLFNFTKEICGIDLNPLYVEKAKKSYPDNKRIRVKTGTIIDLPYPDEYFDFIICSEILEHVPDDKKALRELRRVLKYNGKLLVTVPNLYFPFFWDPVNWLLMRLFHTHVHKDIWWLAGIWADHVRLYTDEQMQKLIIKQGFTVKESVGIIHYCWPFTHFLLYGIGKNIVERMGASEFDRFTFKKKPFANFLSSIFSFPSRFDPERGNTFVNFAYFCEKK